jgi:hypothetical protein
VKKYSAVVGLLLLLAVGAVAAPNVYQSKVQSFPRILTNARYVYVAAYDGDQFSPNLLPDDRVAIANVQEALQQWGRYVVVYRPDDADMILLVESRPTEDVVAVYDARVPGSNYLWRAMGRAGLQKGETPLIGELQQAVETATK